MVSQRRLFSFLTVLIFISLFVVACERPLGGSGDDANQTGQTDTDTGGGTDGGGDAAAGDTTAGDTTAGDTTAGDTTDSDGGTAVTDTDSSDEGDSTASDGGDATTDTGDDSQDDSDEVGGAAGDADDTDSNDQTSDDAADDTSDDDAADTADEEGDTADDAAATNDTVDAIPATHTVAAGENLFRIGLRYKLSWVAIAHENNLANPHILSIGQVLKLPGASAPAPVPGPTPSPQTETTYIVKAGDTLYRIGLQYGISWVQIAEANGLVNNPNLIAIGSELKIPVNTPGPAPQFTHTVQLNETLFLISLRYGVAWPAIAEANGLTSPYVIYAGQTLEIPGSQ